MRGRIVEIAAVRRTEAGKSAAKRLRAAGQVPAVIYARGVAPTPIAVDEAEFRRAVPEAAWYATPFRLALKGRGRRGVSPTAMVVEVQRDAVRGRILAIDFHAVSLNEPVHTQVPVRVTGESEAVKQGGIIEVLVHEVPVEALPTEIPDHLDADISGLDFQEHLHVSDLVVPSGVKVLAPAEEAVLVIAPPAKPEEVVPEAVVEAEAPEVVAEQEIPGQQPPSP